MAQVAGDAGTGARTTRPGSDRCRSPRECEMAIAVGQGHSNVDIARQLHMSLAMVKAHLSRLLVKLGVGNRVRIALLLQVTRATVRRPTRLRHEAWPRCGWPRHGPLPVPCNKPPGTRDHASSPYGRSVGGIHGRLGSP
jgi:DNA-binding CsgD family transcriptional regulator